MRYGREVFRTPIAHRAGDPVFNWQFDVRLPADLPTAAELAAATAAAAAATGSAGMGESGGAEGELAAAPPPHPHRPPHVLHFRVLNARTLGEPEVGRWAWPA
jgi:hypothetical protein